MSKKGILIPIIPAAPACFPDRLTWVEFVVSSDHASGRDHRGPLDLRKPGARFNHEWNFCEDCLALHALAMHAAGRCNPSHLRDMVAAVAEEKAGA